MASPTPRYTILVTIVEGEFTTIRSNSIRLALSGTVSVAESKRQSRFKIQRLNTHPTLNPILSHPIPFRRHPTMSMTSSPLYPSSPNCSQLLPFVHLDHHGIIFCL